MRQYLAEVERKRAELAARSGSAVPGVDAQMEDAKTGSEGDKRLKTEAGWVMASAKGEVVKDEVRLSNMKICISPD